VTGG
jgi:hypothetical protein